MKKLIFALLLIPFASKAQEVRHFCSFDAENAAKHIMMLHIIDNLHDTVEFSVEKKGFKYNKKYLTSVQAEKKLKKVLKKGKSAYSSRTNSGYVFSIVVVSLADDTEILNFIKFEVDHFYQKITSIEVSKGQ
jgi:hypothetical protein